MVVPQSDTAAIAVAAASGTTNTSTNTNTIINALPENLLPITSEEQALLDLYARVKQFEKDAAEAKAEAARAKLMAANEEYQREREREQQEKDGDLPDRKRVKGSASSSGGRDRDRDRDRDNHGHGDQYSDDDEDSSASVQSEILTDTDDEEKKTFRRNEQKIKRLRQKRDRALRRQEEEQASAKAEEEKRKQFLATEDVVGGVDTTDYGPSLVKKNKHLDREGVGGKTSLISMMGPVSTPPHDFSKTLEMSRVNGMQLFPAADAGASAKTWTPPDTATMPDDGCLQIELNEFDASKAAVGSGNNTVAIKFSSPSASKRFSMNLLEPNHENYYSVLFHFNPRQFERGGQVVINDKKAGMWGQAINVPLSSLPLMFGETACTVIVQIGSEGFDVYMNGKHCARLEHRTPLPDKARSLILQLPSTDDYGHREDWEVYKVWWGHKASMESKDNLANVPGVNSHSAVHEKKLFVSGLDKISLQPQIDLRRAELERAFRKYGGLQGATVICPPNCTFAFVEVETERMADLALREMGGKYRLNRARRSRHEALLAQRAANEGTKDTSTKRTSDWE